MIDNFSDFVTYKGGAGSGNWGHVGRPGKVGGSAPGHGGIGLGKALTALTYSRYLGEGEDVVKVQNKAFVDTLENEGLLAPVHSTTSDNARAKTKRDICTRIAQEADVSHEFVSRILSAWASSSNNPIAYLFRKAVSDEFGIEMSAYEKDDGEQLDKKLEEVRRLEPEMDRLKGVLKTRLSEMRQEFLEKLKEETGLDISEDELVQIVDEQPQSAWNEYQAMEYMARKIAEKHAEAGQVAETAKKIENIAGSFYNKSHLEVPVSIQIGEEIGNTGIAPRVTPGKGEIFLPRTQWIWESVIGREIYTYRTHNVMFADMYGEMMAGNREFLTGDAIPKLRRVARAMYNQTQTRLKDLRIRKLMLARGVSSHNRNIQTGQNIAYQGNSIESWSTSQSVASSFGSLVFEAIVPAESVFCLSLDGLGCPPEEEVVVFGNIPGSKVSVLE